MTIDLTYMSEWTYSEIAAQGQTSRVAMGRDQESAVRRIVYRIDTDAIVIADVFSKKTRSTPGQVIATCRRRLREYDDAS